MDEHLKSLLLDGIECKRKRLDQQLKNVLTQKYDIIENYPGGMVPFIEEIEKELRKIRFELNDLDKLEKETNGN